MFCYCMQHSNCYSNVKNVKNIDHRYRGYLMVKFSFTNSPFLFILSKFPSPLLIRFYIMFQAPSPLPRSMTKVKFNRKILQKDVARVLVSGPFAYMKNFVQHPLENEIYETS